MNLTRRQFTAAIGAAPLLSLTGCGTSPIDILNLAVSALEFAVPLIGPAAGIPPAITAAVEQYLSGASDFIATASEILSSPGLSVGEKAAAITAAFAGLAAPFVPAQFKALADAIQKLAKYIADFLATIPHTAAAARAMSPSQTTIKPADVQKLVGIRSRAQAAKAKLPH